MVETKIASPVTGRHPTTVLQTFPVETIVALYKKMGLNVSRFFTGITEVQLLQCNATGYRFYSPFHIFGDGAFYAEIQTANSNYYASRWEHTVATDQIKPGQRVLEVGSGSGLFLQLLKNKGIEAQGLELNTQAIKEAEGKGLRVENKLLESFATTHHETKDVVCSFQVLEHISTVQSYIESALAVLKPGGQLIIGVPNNNPFLFKHDVYHTLNLPPHHAGLWNRKAFEALPHHFPMELTSVHIEPLTEYKQWYQVQLAHMRTQNPLLSQLMQLVPRIIYKPFLRIRRHHIEGRNIVAVFKKL